MIIKRNKNNRLTCFLMNWGHALAFLVIVLVSLIEK